MKYLTIGWVLFLFVSCKDERKQAAAAPLNIDSTFIPKAATNPYEPIDVSPMDVSYFPADLPIEKMNNPAVMPAIRLFYSRPHRQGRKIFGNLVKYGEPWRLGANEATEIEFFRPVIIQGKTISKGRYIMYCIPQPDKWTLVLNSNIYSWGLKFVPQKDVYRFQIPVEESKPTIEFFTMVFEKTESGAVLIIAWENIVARLPITFIR